MSVMVPVGDDPIRVGYDLIAESYASTAHVRLQRAPLLRSLLTQMARLATAVPGSGPVCDVGCGPGVTTAYLATRGVRVCGIDLSPRMVQTAARRHPHIPFRTGSVTALPVPDGDWSGAVCLEVLPHLTDDGRRAALDELARATRPEGWLLLSFRTRSQNATVRLEEWWGMPVSMEFHYQDPETVVGELTKAGWHTESRTVYAPGEDSDHPDRIVVLLARRDSPDRDFPDEEYPDEECPGRGV